MQFITLRDRAEKVPQFLGADAPVMTRRRVLRLAMTLSLGVPLVALAGGCGGGNSGGTGGNNNGNGGGGGTAPQLTTTRLPDGSGSIGIAPGWTLTAGANGAASATASDGSELNLGIPLNVVASNIAQQFPDVPSAGLYPGVARVDFSDPVRAYLDFIKQKGAAAGIQVTQVHTVEYVAMPNGKAAYIRLSGTNNGKPYEQFGLFSIAPIDNAQGLLYFSEVSSPQASFAQQLPAMLAMWNSWSLNPDVVKGRLDEAAKALSEVDYAGTINSVEQNRRQAGEAAAGAWNDYLRQ